MTYRDNQLDAVGAKTRRAILARLRKGPLPVVEIARGFSTSRPAISQQQLPITDEHEQGTDKH